MRLLHIITANFVPITVTDMLPLPLFYYFELAALLTAVLLLTKKATVPLHWFRFFLAVVLLVELSARYLRKIRHESNVWIYNISIPLEYIFYGLVFYYAAEKKMYKKIFRLFLLIYPVFVLINLCFIQGFSDFNQHSMLAGSVFMLLLSGLMLYDIFIREADIHIVLQPFFWIASGVLLFNAGEFGYLLFSKYLINDGVDKAAEFFGQLNSKLIFVLYSCLVIGFICHRITEKYRMG